MSSTTPFDKPYENKNIMAAIRKYKTNMSPEQAMKDCTTVYNCNAFVHAKEGGKVFYMNIPYEEAKRQLNKSRSMFGFTTYLVKNGDAEETDTKDNTQLLPDGTLDLD